MVCFGPLVKICGAFPAAIPCAVCVSVRQNGKSFWRSGKPSWQSTDGLSFLPDELPSVRPWGSVRITGDFWRPCGMGGLACPPLTPIRTRASRRQSGLAAGVALAQPFSLADDTKQCTTGAGSQATWRARSAVQYDVGWCWTGAAGWGRVAPLGWLQGEGRRAGGGRRRRGQRAWRCWGSRRYRELPTLNVQVRIPALEDTGQFPVQRPHARL